MLQYKPFIKIKSKKNICKHTYTRVQNWLLVCCLHETAQKALLYGLNFCMYVITPLCFAGWLCFILKLHILCMLKNRLIFYVYFSAAAHCANQIQVSVCMSARKTAVSKLHISIFYACIESLWISADTHSAHARVCLCARVAFAQNE